MKRVAWLAFVLFAFAWLAPAVAADTVVYYHTDALRSVSVVTDAQGNVLERTRYAPYGQVLNRPLRDGPGYTGHQEDAATGLVYAQQRYYDPETGRFLSVDPVQADANTGANFNRYWYANDNPYRYTDPDGRETTGEFLDRHAQAASDSGNRVATYAFALAGTTWSAFGAEGISQLADKGWSGSNADDKVGAALAVAAVLPPGRLVKEVAAVKGAAGGERAGKAFTRAGRAEVKAENAASHEGQTTCAHCGRATVPAEKSRAGVTPPGNETHVDHVIAKSKGGDGAPANGQVLCRDCNLRKSNHDPKP